MMKIESSPKKIGQMQAGLKFVTLVYNELLKLT